jgi:hypothetical protein
MAEVKGNDKRCERTAGFVNQRLGGGATAGK